MGASLKDIIGLMSVINQTYSSINQNKLHMDKFNNFEERLETANFWKQDALEKKSIAELTANKAMGQYNTSVKNIQDNLDELSRWGITSDLVKDKVKSHLQTDGFKNYSDKQVSNLNENLAFDFDLANTSRGTYSNMIDTADENDRINQVLTGMIDEVTGLREHEANVGIADGIKELKDYEDFDAYVESKPQIFKEPAKDEFGNTRMDKDGTVYSDTDNYLGVAFKHYEHKYGGESFGYVPEVSDAAKISAAGTKEEVDMYKLSMDATSSDVSDYLKQQTGTDYSEISDNIKKLVTPISAVNLTKNSLGKDINYNTELAYGKLKNIYNIAATNVDNMLTEEGQGDVRGGVMPWRWGADEEAHTLYEAGGFKGSFIPGVNETAMVGNAEPGVKGYIGTKDNDGLLVKRAEATGEYYFDTQAYRRIFGSEGDETKAEFMQVLKENLLIAKKMQQSSPFAGGFLEGDFNAEAFENATEADYKHKAGIMSNEELEKTLLGLQSQEDTSMSINDREISTALNMIDKAPSGVNYNQEDMLANLDRGIINGKYISSQEQAKYKAGKITAEELFARYIPGY